MKKILLSILIIFSATISFSQTRVLYYTDGATIGTDQMVAALTNTGCIVTSAVSDLDFQTQIAMPTNFDMAIYFVQNNTSVNATATALANFVNLGNKGMYADWSLDVTNGALMGVNFTGSINETVVTITDATLAAGITVNPFTITNTGWGTFSYGLLPLSGSTVAGTFASGQAALIKSMSDNMLVFGYLGDVTATSEMYETAITTLFPTATSVLTPEVSTFNTILYPNPTTTSVTISVDNSATQSFEISILDIQGKVIYKTSENNGSSSFSKTINTSEIAKGLYYVHVKSAETQKISKLIIQ